MPGPPPPGFRPVPPLFMIPPGGMPQGGPIPPGAMPPGGPMPPHFMSGPRPPMPGPIPGMLSMQRIMEEPLLSKNPTLYL